MYARLFIQINNRDPQWKNSNYNGLSYSFTRFINTNDNQFLDFPGQDGWGYCVFGEVVAGQDIVDKIEKVETINLGGHADVPGETVIINKASLSEQICFDRIALIFAYADIVNHL